MTKRIGASAVAVGLALTATACGGDSGSTSTADGVQEITIALPFSSCLAWWPMYTALEEGYFEDAGIAPAFEGLDGGPAAIQATQAGQAQMAMSEPDNYLTAVAQGVDVTSLYAFYQDQTFHLVTASDSGITTPAQLDGRTVGISTPGAGDDFYAQSLLEFDAALGADQDYERLAVGDGASAAAALQSGVVDAYSASYFDAEVIRSSGVELTTVSSPDYPRVVGELLLSTSEWAEENGDLIDGFGRAVAQGTAWGLENLDAIIDICSEHAPEETEDREFAETITNRVAELVSLPEGAEGYGWFEEEAWADYRDLLIDVGLVPEAASEAGVDNSRVATWNKS
jgi:NitT/TauT family transport system substrate-binding protein